MEAMIYSAGLSVDAGKREVWRPSWERKLALASLLASISDAGGKSVVHPQTPPFSLQYLLLSSSCR